MNLVGQLTAIVGRRHVLTRSTATRPYRTAFRSGDGECLAVVRPGKLIEFWRVLNACAAADVAIIVQAANTGLTGGSTPDTGYDRPIVIINTLRLGRVQPMNGGQQVLCHAGATLHRLEKLLAPLGREPHSVIGSSCIGASVIGGIANNSGGALVRRGPAYTEMAIYAQLDRDGRLRLVNHLGLALGVTPEAMLARLDDPEFEPDRVTTGTGKGSDSRYASEVREIDAETPARFNADPQRLYEASGSAGKVAVFAVRVDSFAREADARTFYIGTDDPAELTALRRVLLAGDAPLPIAAEYIHGEAFDLADRYGKDLFLAIQTLGTDRLPALARLQRRVDWMAAKIPGLPASISERILQAAGRLLPDHLPARMRDFRARFSHHLLLKVPAEGVDPSWAALHGILGAGRGDYFLCTPEEEASAFRHRFVTAGAAVRYRSLHAHSVEDVLSLDIALKRSERDWFEVLPPELEAQIEHKLYYGHFFCHVLHQDYVVKKGVDVAALKRAMLERLDARGAEYPAEHNVGHSYAAKPALEAHYRSLDPCNAFNPGIGKLTKRRNWATDPPDSGAATG